MCRVMASVLIYHLCVLANQFGKYGEDCISEEGEAEIVFYPYINNKQDWAAMVHTKLI